MQQLRHRRRYVEVTIQQLVAMFQELPEHTVSFATEVECFRTKDNYEPCEWYAGILMKRFDTTVLLLSRWGGGCQMMAYDAEEQSVEECLREFLQGISWSGEHLNIDRWESD